ncbi:hypothetical protein AD006_29100 (plasmid) [Pseudonocardia sp. EC080610-09]|nr:hypothetical protein AD006_29100 [Pseudonocardia sp. EC080610-09]ALL85319.1 hypothetical protein AD017_29490 [Pseudonocardia sp. EC080619-01]
MAAMHAKRDQLDRDQEEQRRLEESAFERYARAQERIAEVEHTRDETLAELDRRREQAVADAEQELASIGVEQCAVMAELHGRRRNAEDLAAMFGVPVKRVRTMLRRTRDGAPSPTDGSGHSSEAVTPAADGHHDPGPREQYLASGSDGEKSETPAARAVGAVPAATPG